VEIPLNWNDAADHAALPPSFSADGHGGLAVRHTFADFKLLRRYGYCYTFPSIAPHPTAALGRGSWK
jgi:hypothetical protein